MADSNTYLWNNLPDHIIVYILSYLPFPQRCRASQVCQNWLSCFNHPALWKTFKFNFNTKLDHQYLNLVKLHGHHMKTIKIVLNQHEKENRENACQVLNIIKALDNQKVTSLCLDFTGENPLFYAGSEFVHALKSFFSCNIESNGTLTCVDLSGLWIDLSQEVLDVLSTHHRNLKKLNIQNRSLICKVEPICITRLVERCKKLTNLFLFYCSLSDEVLDNFADTERAPLEYLSIKCRRQEKYVKILSEDSWKNLIKVSINLKVSMIFDHNCLLEKVSSILSPAIPVVELRLETFTFLFDEINMAASYYEHCLERLVIQTRNSKELEESLINVARRCHKLKSLLVYCVLSKHVVDLILTLCPRLTQTKNYILKSTMDPEPWVVGIEEGD